MKLKLDDLKVQSFVTSLTDDESRLLRGRSEDPNTRISECGGTRASGCCPNSDAYECPGGGGSHWCGPSANTNFDCTFTCPSYY